MWKEKDGLGIAISIYSMQREYSVKHLENNLKWGKYMKAII